MADFTSKKPSATYKSILNVGTSDNEELGSGLKVIEDGAGNDSSMKLSLTGSTYGASFTGRVGIGVDTPGAELHLEQGDFRINNATNGHQVIQFAEAGTVKSKVGYNNSNDSFIISTLDGSGNLDTRLNIFSETDNSTVQITNAGQSILSLNNTATNGDQFRIISKVNGTTAGLLFKDESSATNIMTLTEDGEVGIGTTIPEKALHVVSGTGTDLTTALKLQKKIDGSGTATGILLGAVSAGHAKSGIFFENDGSGHGRGNLHFSINTAGDTSEAVLADAKITIDSNGDVGIGTVSPASKLEVEGIISSYGTSHLIIRDDSGATITSGGNTEGNLAVTHNFHLITHGAGDNVANVNLINITGGTDGSILVLKQLTNTKDVKFIDGDGSGTGGNLRLNGDFQMNTGNDTITLIKSGTIWFELSRSNNAD